MVCGVEGPHRSPFSVVEDPGNGGWFLSVFEDLKAIEAGDRGQQYPDGPTSMSSKQPVCECLSSSLLAGFGSVEVISNSDVSLCTHTTQTYICTQRQHRYTTCPTYVDSTHM